MILKDKLEKEKVNIKIKGRCKNNPYGHWSSKIPRFT